MKKKKLLLSLAMAMMSLAGFAADDLPALHVEGKNLVDANGKTVVLHGVMDTPNRYFNGNRWGTGGYNVSDITPCLNYFEKMFTAITDKEQGAYCTVFRLHMDPCWTNYNAPAGTHENNIQYFNETRYKTFLSKLYVKLVEKALAHGLYVIVRPPGVCPQNIKVGDEYQAYLKKVWKLFASNATIQKNAGQVSIELANEPINVLLANGSKSDMALHDFFQPVVDEIRATGFKGIIWVPGSGYQSQYQSYVKFPITDSEDNFSYAVHVYSGWYNASDQNCNHNAFIKQFQAQVPMVTSKPIMVTEIDWSPEDPDKTSEGHYNEWGQWTQPNLGSWATASTSKWGLAWKAVHDHFGNIGMTLTHPQEYYDIDEYLKNGKVIPGFQNAKKHHLFEECCGYACMNWYKEWYLKQTSTGIETKVNDAEVAYTLYYNIAGEKVNKPEKGIYIVKQVLKDGKVRTKKICY